jgi:ethanolamine utilization microcompartment shell protein EutS
VLKLTAKPELAVAVKVGVDPNACAPGLGKLIVWLAFGVTALEAADICPVPAAFVAVTVNV